MSGSVSICFESERFDHTSELPEDINAGNRFYGRDVADFLSAELKKQGFSTDFFDEDWGWLVEGATSGGAPFEIAIYHLAEDEEGASPGGTQWGLSIRAYERTKLLGFLPRTREIAVPAELRDAIEQAIASTGAQPRPWNDEPGAGT